MRTESYLSAIALSGRRRSGAVGRQGEVPSSPRQFPAGAKRLALLRGMVVVTGMRGTRVLQAVCDDPLAGTRLADGTLRISPRLCDALIEVLGYLPIEPVPPPLNRQSAIPPVRRPYGAGGVNHQSLREVA